MSKTKPIFRWRILLYIFIPLVILYLPLISYIPENQQKWFSISARMSEYKIDLSSDEIHASDSIISDQEMHDTILEMNALREKKFLKEGIKIFFAEDSEIGDKTLKLLLSMDTVRDISVSNCHNISDEAFTGEISQNIETLGIIGCNVSQPVIDRLLLSHPNMKVFYTKKELDD